MQSDEKTISALTAQAHNAEADKRTLQSKLAASERRVQDLEKRLTELQAASEERVRSLTDQLSQEMTKVSDMMQQLVSYMMGKGDVTLEGTIHETVVVGIREEVRQEFRAMLDEKDAMLSEKDARIAALEALVNQDHDGEPPLITIKKLEHQNEDLRRTTYGQKTEGKYNGRNDMTPADEADLNGEDVPESTFDVSEEEFMEVMDVINSARKNAIKSNGRKKGQKVPHRFQPLKASAREIIIEPKDKPEGATLCEGKERRTYRIVHHPAWVEYICFVCPKYEKDHKYYQAKAPKHSMGKCKADASILSWIIYEHLVKHVTLGEIEQDLKSMGLNIAHATLCHWMELAAEKLEPLDKETEPDLVRAVNFALKEYPQLLRYLDDGKLAFSNNLCELQMRQIAIYRNQSYFLGSVKSARRFARLVSLTQSAKNCKRNVQKYFHDILNRAVVTVKEELVSILPHKWVEPVTIPLVY